MKLSAEQAGLHLLPRYARAGIWDAFYYPGWQENTRSTMAEAFERERVVAERFGISRQCALLHIGLGTAADPAADRKLRAAGPELRRLLTQRSDRLLGFARLNANDVPGSLAAIADWIVSGPMVGVCFPAAGQPGSLECHHPNFDPIVRATAAAGAVFFQMNRYVSGEKDNPLLSTPAKLAVLAGRHPTVQFISGHAGGDWEKGIRAVRARPNILVETSGFDPTAGFIEMAVRELGPERVVFGTHLPGRSLGTECAKVFSAHISEADKALILRGNLERLLAGILRKKGMSGG